ncbi:MAG: hypothetical protein ACK5MA_09410 [Parachlamydiaceae bacterium]
MRRVSRSHKNYIAYSLTPELYRGIALYRNRRIILLKHEDSIFKKIFQFILKQIGWLKTDFHTIHCFTEKWRRPPKRSPHWHYDEELSPEINQCLNNLYTTVFSRSPNSEACF